VNAGLAAVDAGLLAKSASSTIRLGERGLLRAKEGAAGGTTAGRARAGAEVRRQELEDSGGLCRHCGRITSQEEGPARQQFDHEIPKSRGGNTSYENINNSCARCNGPAGKWARTSREWRAVDKWAARRRAFRRFLMFHHRMIFR
jgi:5-methylcytosine-specific restriction endonuclease McrA